MGVGECEWVGAKIREVMVYTSMMSIQISYSLKSNFQFRFDKNLNHFTSLLIVRMSVNPMAPPKFIYRPIQSTDYSSKNAGEKEPANASVQMRLFLKKITEL
jgi:hypothetical protein